MELTLTAQATELADGRPVWVQFLARAINPDGVPMILSGASFAGVVRATDAAAAACHEKNRSGGVFTPEAERLVAIVAPYLTALTDCDATRRPNG